MCQSEMQVATYTQLPHAYVIDEILDYTRQVSKGLKNDGGVGGQSRKAEQNVDFRGKRDDVRR